MTAFPEWSKAKEMMLLFYNANIFFDHIIWVGVGNIDIAMLPVVELLVRTTVY